MGNKILKFICGAGNEDLDEIEKLSYVYAKAGFNMIDTAPKEEAVNSVLAGIKKAGMENCINICVSIGLKDDIHLSKALINPLKCDLCGICEKECPRNAIFKQQKEFIVNKKRCIGCGKCLKVCYQNAIIQKYGDTSFENLIFQNKNIDCVEFHCTSDNENEILHGWNNLKEVYNGQLSICMNRSKLGDERIISLLKQMTQGLNNVIIQADGNPMTGGVNDYKSNLQTVSFAQLIRDNKISAKVILSGGTNSKTAQFAKLCEVDIDGIAIGSFARKLINEYVKNELFWENKEIQKEAVKKAKFLVMELMSQF